MAPSDDTLDALRRAIDSVDDAMHDLLMKRAALSERVRAAKGVAVSHVFRPGREAAILQRLVARHTGTLPPAVVAQVWREIIAASVRLQTSFEIAVYAPRTKPHVLDLARAHFGALTPIGPVSAPGAVLAALAEGRAQAGVLPLPEDVPDEPWWRDLGIGAGKGLRILARIPVVTTEPAQGALVIGPQPFDRAGDDRGYLVVEAEQAIDRAGLARALKAVDLRPIGIAAQVAGPAGAVLVETQDYVAPDDPRLGRLVAETGGAATTARAIGGYAVPVAPGGGRRPT